MLRWLTLSCLLLSSLHIHNQPAAIEMGSICGTVQDETGAPASLIQIVAIDLAPHSGPYQSGKTDESGRYCVTGLHLGEYAMSAFDEEKGYPLMSLALYAEHLPGERITLSLAAPRAHVDFRIPYKAGLLYVVAKDARTGQPVTHIRVELSVRFDESFRYSQGGPPDRALLLPPNEDILVTVSAPGYDSWPEGKGSGRLTHLQPGAKQILEVALKPTAP